MEDSEEMVCGYAAWPLGRIGGSQTRQVMETSLAVKHGRQMSLLRRRFRLLLLLHEQSIGDGVRLVQTCGYA